MGQDELIVHRQDQAVGPGGNGDHFDAGGMQRLRGGDVAHTGLERHPEQLGGLLAIGLDAEGTCRQSVLERRAAGIQKGPRTRRLHDGDQPGIEIGRRRRWQGAAKGPEVAGARQAGDTFRQGGGVVRVERGARLVDLGSLVGRLVAQGDVASRFAGNFQGNDVETGCHETLMHGTARPACQQGDDGAGKAQSLQGAGDVNPFASEVIAHDPRPIDLAQAQFRHDEGAVESRVKGDGDDHGGAEFMSAQR